MPGKRTSARRAGTAHERGLAQLAELLVVAAVGVQLGAYLGMGATAREVGATALDELGLGVRFGTGFHAPAGAGGEFGGESPTRGR